jgi:hypothetical protein
MTDGTEIKTTSKPRPSVLGESVYRDRVEALNEKIFLFLGERCSILI